MFEFIQEVVTVVINFTKLDSRKFGIYQPEAGTIPFRQVLNWKTLIAPRAFQRPFTPRSLFSMYGWRYAARVFYRYRPPEAPPTSEPGPGTVPDTAAAGGSR